jgi:hypothetical protein
MPVLVLSTIPSASTWLIVASLYILPLMVLKSSANASDADRSAKIASVLAQQFMRRILRLFLSTSQRQNDMNWPNDAGNIHGCCDCFSFQRGSGTIASSHL